MDEAKFVKAMNIDKKVADGKLRLILLKATFAKYLHNSLFIALYQKTSSPL